jgi:nitrate/nitrite-specific signal transduction histidine kinase
MNQLSLPMRFPTQINRRLRLAFASFIAIVLIVGGISLTLAVRIHRTNRIVDQENAHIQSIGSIHSVLNEIIVELDQMEDSGQFDRLEHVLTLHEKLGEQLGTLRMLHQADGHIPDEQESVLLSGLGNIAKELQEFTSRLVAAPISSRRFGPRDPEWLNLMSHDTVAKAEGLRNIHRMKITDLLQSSEGMLRAVVALYLAFVFVSGGLLVLTGIGFSRGIAAPLQKLSDAATGIAEGRLDERVPVRSLNEIGQLSQAFNVIADRLQSHERELRVTDEQLGLKVREAQALYQISTEISDLREVNRILQSVAEKARELIRSDAAAICLLALGEDELAVRATSGPPQAFRSRKDPTPWSVVAGEAMGAHNRYCPAIQPEYLRAHLAVPLCRGKSEIGVICVSSQEAREFSATHTELLTGLATQAVIAIENARLYDEVRSLAMLEERDRLARELHDGLAQALGLLHLKLTHAQEKSASADFPKMADALQEMTAITDHAYEDLRQSMFGLRTKMPRELGLIAGLTKYFHDFSAQSGLPVELEVGEGQPVHLSPASEVQLVRIVQEALANVRKHAAARRAWVRLHRQDPWIHVTIEDDGRGFDLSILTSGKHRAFGLQTMRERAEAVGGSLEIDTGPGRGTRIVATLPEGA